MIEKNVNPIVFQEVDCDSELNFEHLDAFSEDKTEHNTYSFYGK